MIDDHKPRSIRGLIAMLCQIAAGFALGIGAIVSAMWTLPRIRKMGRTMTGDTSPDRAEFAVPEQLDRLITMAQQTKHKSYDWRHALRPFREPLHEALVELRSLPNRSPDEERALTQIEDILEIEHPPPITPHAAHNIDSDRLDWVIAFIRDGWIPSSNIDREWIDARRKSDTADQPGDR